MIERFTSSRYRIHLSIDIWTAPAGNRSYLDVIAHWCDVDYNIQTALIALRPVEGRHSGVNIAGILTDVIETYRIGHKIGYCMGDNASNNTTAVEELQSLLISNFGEDAGVIPTEERRLRCLAHILNLGAKNLLFGKSIDALELSIDVDLTFEEEKAEEEEFAKWRKAGVIGKSHNLVHFIHHSDQRKDAFRALQVDLLHYPHSIMISIDNTTRWNSTFLMINDLLNLREAVDLYVSISLTSKAMEAKYKRKLEQCQPTESDWEELIDLHALLYPFWELTIKMQGQENCKRMLTMTRP